MDTTCHADTLSSENTVRDRNLKVAKARARYRVGFDGFAKRFDGFVTRCPDFGAMCRTPTALN
jgi:hypothetical protein